MKFNYKKIVPFIGIICSSAINAQAPAIEWQKSLGGTNSDRAHTVIQTTDGGYN